MRLCLTPGKCVCHAEMLIQFAIVSSRDFVCCQDRGREKACPPEMTSPRLLPCFYFKEDIGGCDTAPSWEDLGVGGEGQS